MTTKEAIQALLDDKKVRSKTWSEDIYMYFDEDKLFDSNGTKFNTFSMSFFDDWEIYEEPKSKQTVTIKKWLCKDDTGAFLILEGNDERFAGVSMTKVKLLDTYEVKIS